MGIIWQCSLYAKKNVIKKCNGLKLLTFPYMRNPREINKAHLHSG